MSCDYAVGHHAPWHMMGNRAFSTDFFPVEHPLLSGEKMIDEVDEHCNSLPEDFLFSRV